MRAGPRHRRGLIVGAAFVGDTFWTSSGRHCRATIVAITPCKYAARSYRERLHCTKAVRCLARKMTGTMRKGMRSRSRAFWPGDDWESAILATLIKGGSTGIIRGKDTTAGVALTEECRMGD